MTDTHTFNTKISRALSAIAFSALLVPQIANAEKIMAIGDSITESAAARSYPFSNTDFPLSAWRNDPGGPPGTLRSYREHLHDLLIDASCDADVTWVGARGVANRVPESHEGHSGWRVDELLTRTWPEQGTTSPTNDLDGWLSEYSPDVVLIHAGTNDMLEETDANSIGATAVTTAAELGQMLDKVYAQNANMTVLIANVIPIYGWYADHQNVSPFPLLSVDNANELEAAALSAEIQSLVAARPASEDIHLVDVRNGFFVDEANVVSCPAGTGGSTTNDSMTVCKSTGGYDFADGVHPSIWGDNHIANKFYDVIYNNTNICSTTGPGPDVTAPDSDVDADPGGLQLGTITFSGTATDDLSGVQTVKVRIRRLSDNLNYSGVDWVSSANTWLDAAGTTSWSIDVPVSEAGNYTVWAYAIDNDGNVETWADGRDSESFTIGSSGTGDVVAPDSDVAPDPGGLTTGTVTFSGTATDDSSGVQSVNVRIRRLSDNRNYSGSSWVTTANTWVIATGTTSWSVDVPVTEAGNYTVWAYATDNDGNIETWADGRDSESFTIGSTGGADTTAPDSDVNADPGNLTEGTVTFSGTASDDSAGVQTVRVRIRRLSDNLNYSGSGWVASANTWLVATGADIWSIDVPVIEGDYRVWAYAEDAVGNIETWADGRDTENFSIGPVGGGGSNLMVEGEVGTFTGDFVAANDGLASGGMYAHVPAGGGAGDYHTHSAAYTVNITTAGTYKVNASVYAAATNQNSFFAQIGTGSEYIWHIPATSAYVNDFVSNRVGGNDVDVEIMLTPGSHTLYVYFREEQARLDWIEFVLQ